MTMNILGTNNRPIVMSVCVDPTTASINWIDGDEIKSIKKEIERLKVELMEYYLLGDTSEKECGEYLERSYKL